MENKQQTEPKNPIFPTKSPVLTTNPVRVLNSSCVRKQRKTPKPAATASSFLLKQARDLVSSNGNPEHALNLALRAMNSFPKSFDNDKSNLWLVKCLHIIATIRCRTRDFSGAIADLERSIEIARLMGEPLALFSGYMQLGDTYALLGRLERSIDCYNSGLEVQKKELGKDHPTVGATYQYIAEAYLQAMQFDEAEKLCLAAMAIHRRGSPEEAAVQQLLGLVADAQGNHEAALEHFVLASSNVEEEETGHLDCYIGDAYLSMSMFDEAGFSFQKALDAFQSIKEVDHQTISSIFVRLANLCNKTGKLKECKSHLENALIIYEKPPLAGELLEDSATGLAELAAVYEAMNDNEQALKMLMDALRVFEASGPERQEVVVVASIEAQVGTLLHFAGDHTEALRFLESAVSRLRGGGRRKPCGLGAVLNQMGIVYVELGKLNEAARMFEEARGVLQEEWGPYHHETLQACGNLAGTYDAMGRLDDAVEILEYVVLIRENESGTAGTEVDEEKKRLEELLREAGWKSSRKSTSLQNLLGTQTGISISTVKIDRYS